MTRNERFNTCEILQSIRARQIAAEAIKQNHDYAESHPGCVIVHDELILLPNEKKNDNGQNLLR